MEKPVVHYPSTCTFCKNPMTFHKNEKDEKVIDKPCDCSRSKEYFAKKAAEKKSGAKS